MKKLSVKDLVEFRYKSDKSKKTFVNNLKKDKEISAAEGGGDYWVSCLSAISQGYKLNSLKPILERKEDLNKRYAGTEITKTKNMYKRNIDILSNYENFELAKLRPDKKIEFQIKSKEDSIMSLKGVELKATPDHVFTFERKDIDEVGAIWFVAKLNGLKKEELGMFTDLLYRYLKSHYSKEFRINPKYCIAVDVFSKQNVNYSQLEKNQVAPILSKTLEELKKMI